MGCAGHRDLMKQLDPLVVEDQFTGRPGSDGVERWTQKVQIPAAMLVSTMKELSYWGKSSEGPSRLLPPVLSHPLPIVQLQGWRALIGCGWCGAVAPLRMRCSVGVGVAVGWLM